MKIWIDVENLPQVLFFSPALRALEAKGHAVFITALRKTYLPELCLRKGWQVQRSVGTHTARGKAFKIAGGLMRAVRLASAVKRFEPDVLVNFASRPAILAAAGRRIPAFTVFDYEHVALPLVGRLSRTICLPTAVRPEALEKLGIPREKVLWFPATKEDLYASDFRPSPVRARLGVPEGEPFALLRPPATTAHYHDPRSEVLYDALLERISRDASVHARVLGRTESDRAQITARFPGHPRIQHCDSTEDGLNLIWNADLVVSGGGTMSREAAALGVPSYSIFTGPIGAVDRWLFEQGRVVHVDRASDLDRIRLERDSRTRTLPTPRPDLVDLLVRGIEQAAR